MLASKPGYRWIAAALLGAVGLLLNLFPVPLSPGTDLLFGGIASLLAAVALGPVPGLLAAAIASVRTLWLWGHPWAWLIFSAEAWTVGYLVHRWDRRPLSADLLFWLFGGVPLLFLTYGLLMGVEGVTAAVLFLKQPFNGFINALAVEALLLFPAVRRLLRLRREPRLRSTLAVVVTLAAVIPTLIFGIWVGRREWERNLERSRERARMFASVYASQVEQHVLTHARAVRSVAEAAELRGIFDPEQLQRLVAAESEQFPGFVNMYAANSRGVAVAFYPPTNPAGDPLIGLDFSDRPYFRELRQTRETVISDVFAGRGGTDLPLVVIAHPIVLADTLAGYVLGALSLGGFPAPDPVPDPTERVRVVDARGTEAYDSRSVYRPGERPRTFADSVAFAAIQGVGASGTTVYEGSGATAAASTTAARMLAGVARVPSLGWWVWVERPYAVIQAFVSEAYTRLLGLLIAVMLLALLVSDRLARYLAGPLLHLRAVTGRLAAGDLHSRVGRFPAVVPMEVRELGRGFDEMADALAGRTEQLEELGELARSFASTLDADELLRRVTEAATRLIDTDGCGIALLGPRGRILRAADSTAGLLASSAGEEIPVDRSLAGPAVRTGRSILVASIDPRARLLAEAPGTLGSVICAPLIGPGGVLGILVGVRAHSNPDPFSPEDQRLLESLAQHAAIALRNAQLLEAAQAASRAKSDFIATMSHELRTPLNAVLGHLQLLEMEIHGPISDEQRQALGRIEAASRHLRGLIEEVLSFARIEAGRTEINVQPVELGALVEEVAAVIEPLAREKDLRFSVHPVPGGCHLPTDPDKVRQIVINLAGNAVKFTERGSVTLRVEPEGEGWRVEVEDTGPGISEEDRERLFQPFEQLQSGFSREHGGTGLGLYLSWRYAALVGGRIEVESEPGRGSTFSLLLPPEPPRAEEEGARVESEATEAGAR